MVLISSDRLRSLSESSIRTLILASLCSIDKYGLTAMSLTSSGSFYKAKDISRLFNSLLSFTISATRIDEARDNTYLCIGCCLDNHEHILFY